MSNGQSGSLDELLATLKQRMDALEEENHTLRAQLARTQQENLDLRRGIGITVMIDGRPIQTGSGPLPDIAVKPVAAMGAMPVQMPVPPVATPAFATSTERRGSGDAFPPQGSNNPAATIPNELFQQQNTPGAPHSYTPPPPQQSNLPRNQNPPRSGGYRDFFLD
ncbi:MAG TPA: hypothetical protein VKB76_03380 [Ktedonobacterales bacterium]|nr:hypothetical protein [Ktedonobacterales bacterium]